MNTFSRSDLKGLRGLNREYPDRKDAIKRVLANMRGGKGTSYPQDVSGLFPDVLNVLKTEDIKQEKLVYLCLINDAKTAKSDHSCRQYVRQRFRRPGSPHPRPCHSNHGLHTRRKDQCPSGPLQKCLPDENPYVRKTAAAKLCDFKPELVLENVFLEQLCEISSDSNPMVLCFFIVFVLSSDAP